MASVKLDYREWLTRRAAEAHEDAEAASPISLTEFKSRHDLQRWQQRMALIGREAIPPTISTFLKARLPRWMLS